MSTTAGDFVMDRLLAWGVRRIYGYPGDGINGLISAIDRTDPDEGGIIAKSAKQLFAGVFHGDADETGN